MGKNSIEKEKPHVPFGIRPSRLRKKRKKGKLHSRRGEPCMSWFFKKKKGKLQRMGENPHAF
jgi:hypothetical protein